MAGGDAFPCLGSYCKAPSVNSSDGDSEGQHRVTRLVAVRMRRVRARGPADAPKLEAIEYLARQGARSLPGEPSALAHDAADGWTAPEVDTTIEPQVVPLPQLRRPAATVDGSYRGGSANSEQRASRDVYTKQEPTDLSGELAAPLAEPASVAGAIPHGQQRPLVGEREQRIRFDCHCLNTPMMLRRPVVRTQIMSRDRPRL